MYKKYLQKIAFLMILSIVQTNYLMIKNLSIHEFWSGLLQVGYQIDEFVLIAMICLVKMLQYNVAGYFDKW